MTMRPPWLETPEGIELRVRVTPRARCQRVGGVHRGPQAAALVVAVTAPPVEGAANEAVRQALAEALEVPPSAIRLLRGATGRDKTFLVTGQAGRLAERLRAFLT